MRRTAAARGRNDLHDVVVVLIAALRAWRLHTDVLQSDRVADARVQRLEALLEHAPEQRYAPAVLVFFVDNHRDLGRTEVRNNFFPAHKLTDQRGPRNVVRIPPVRQASVIDRELVAKVRCRHPSSLSSSNYAALRRVTRPDRPR